MSAASLINALGFGHGRQTKKPEYATPTVDARLDVIPAAAPYFPKARNLYLSVTIDENAFAKVAPGATIQGVVAKLGKTTVNLGINRMQTADRTDWVDVAEYRNDDASKKLIEKIDRKHGVVFQVITDKGTFTISNLQGKTIIPLGGAH